ncbi:hypothetical protein ACF0H5_001626 [Mactra antiquata]
MEDLEKNSPTQTARNVFLDVLLPVSGCISYEMFSVNIMNTTHITKFLGPSHPVLAEILWFNAHCGLGIYLYRQKIFHSAPISYRIVYSAFLTAMFNFGSALLWGTSKMILPTSSGIRTLCGVGSGLVFLFTGWHFMKFLNTKSSFSSSDNEE